MGMAVINVHYVISYRGTYLQLALCYACQLYMCKSCVHSAPLCGGGEGWLCKEGLCIYGPGCLCGVSVCQASYIYMMRLYNYIMAGLCMVGILWCSRFCISGLCVVGPLYGRALCGRVYVWLDRSFQHPYTIVNVKLSSVDGCRVKYGPLEQ